ncbi:MAG: hypothetical protein E7595_02700 [Ruminococcaceae bacterium]|nr:hypothetical protein [Oscillospiraceae bacterium]
MSSAFKNFFITFAICLLVFILLAFLVFKPLVIDLLSDDGEDTPADESVEESTDISDESSGETSQPVIDPSYDENGDIFTAVVMCVDSNGRALNSVFIDSNGKTKQFIYCTVPSSVKTANEIGATITVGDLFATLTPDAICQSITAMTGIQTDYCLRFDRKGVREIARSIPGASVVLNEDIIIVNPAYSDYVAVPGQPYPDDYYITISNVDGRVLLNEQLNGKSKLDWLLEYNPNVDGSEYNTLYSMIAKSVIRQFFENEAATKSTASMTNILKNCETNLTLDTASAMLETIFSYNDFTRHELQYPSNWETAVNKLRQLDGRFD